MKSLFERRHGVISTHARAQGDDKIVAVHFTILSVVESDA